MARREKQVTEQDVVLALQGTAELLGTQLSEVAARMMLADLQQYPAQQVIGALTRCRKELRGRLTVAEIVSRLPDGRPGADEAWALLPWDEAQSSAVTEEMMEAMGVASQAYAIGDRVGARAAFKETYTRLVAEAREQRREVHWFASYGTDKAGRELAATELTKRLLAGVEAKQIAPPVDAPEPGAVPMPPEVRAQLEAFTKKG